MDFSLPLNGGWEFAWSLVGFEESHLK